MARKSGGKIVHEEDLIRSGMSVDQARSFLSSLGQVKPEQLPASYFQEVYNITRKGVHSAGDNMKLARVVRMFFDDAPVTRDRFLTWLDLQIKRRVDHHQI